MIPIFQEDDTAYLPIRFAQAFCSLAQPSAMVIFPLVLDRRNHPRPHEEQPEGFSQVHVGQPHPSYVTWYDSVTLFESKR